MPTGQRIKRRKRAARLLLWRDGSVRLSGRDNLRGLSGAGIGFPQRIVFELHNAVIIASPAPEHGACGHQRPFSRLNDIDVASPATVPRNPVVRRVGEADELRRFLVEQGVAPLRIGRTRPVPALRIARQDMRLLQNLDVCGAIDRG